MAMLIHTVGPRLINPMDLIDKMAMIVWGTSAIEINLVYGFYNMEPLGSNYAVVMQNRQNQT